MRRNVATNMHVLQLQEEMKRLRCKWQKEYFPYVFRRLFISLSHRNLSSVSEKLSDFLNKNWFKLVDLILICPFTKTLFFLSSYHFFQLFHRHGLVAHFRDCSTFCASPHVRVSWLVLIMFSKNVMGKFFTTRIPMTTRWDKSEISRKLFGFYQNVWDSFFQIQIVSLKWRLDFSLLTKLGHCKNIFCYTKRTDELNSRTVLG